MERVERTLALTERVAIIAAAVAALFPLYQWMGEADQRELDRTLRVVEMLEYCTEFEEQASAGNLNLAAIDIREEFCSAGSRQLENWYIDVFGLGG